MQAITIYGTFPNFNDVILQTKKHWSHYATLKKKLTNQTAIQFKRLKKITAPVKIEFTWICKGKSVDPDNICFAKKYLLDGMVKAGILQDDGWKFIKGFEDKFEVDKKNVGVRIVFYE